jgi:hypothetical protein
VTRRALLLVGCVTALRHWSAVRVHVTAVPTAHVVTMPRLDDALPPLHPASVYKRVVVVLPRAMKSHRATIVAAIGAHGELHPPTVVAANPCCSFLPLVLPKLPHLLVVQAGPLVRRSRASSGARRPALPCSPAGHLQPPDHSPTFSRPSPLPASPESGRPRRPLWPKGHIARSHVIPGPFVRTRGITVSISIFPRVCVQNDSSPLCVLTATCKIHIKS